MSNWIASPELVHNKNSRIFTIHNISVLQIENIDDITSQTAFLSQVRKFYDMQILPWFISSTTLKGQYDKSWSETRNKMVDTERSWNHCTIWHRMLKIQVCEPVEASNNMLSVPMRRLHLPLQTDDVHWGPEAPQLLYRICINENPNEIFKA